MIASACFFNVQTSTFEVQKDVRELLCDPGEFTSLSPGILLCKLKMILYREVLSYRDVASNKLNEIMSMKALYKLKSAVLMCVIIKILGAWK